MDDFSRYEALAGRIKAEDITSNADNAELLRKIMENDPDIDTLSIRYEDLERGGGFDYFYYPSDAREMGWLGYYVGRNTRIKYLYMSGRHDAAVMEPFCRGISENRSISELSMYHFEGGDIFEMLGPFIRNNNRLTSFSADECNFGPEGGRLLSLALGGCKRGALRTVSLADCEINDDQFADIAVALSMHPRLESLALYGNDIGKNGFVALGTLLQFSATKIKALDLDDTGIGDDAMEALVQALVKCKLLENLHLARNAFISIRGWRALAGLLTDRSCALQRLALAWTPIGDEAATLFATALANNETLTRLSINGHSITATGWAAFSALLCDTSSVNKTHSSNHTLEYTSSNDNMPSDVKAYLTMNSRVSKKEIAMIKILANHRDISMQPFFEWDFKVLPHAVKWFERAQSMATSHAATQYQCIQPRKLSAVYQFIRGMPLLYVESCLRVQLDEIRCKELKIDQEQLTLELQMQELQHRKREVKESKQSVMARLRG